MTDENAIVYESTGEIAVELSGSADVLETDAINSLQYCEDPSTANYLLNCADCTHDENYVDLSGAEPVIATRPEMSLILSATEITTAEITTLSGVPSGSTVALLFLHDGDTPSTLTADGTDIELSSPTPGNYRIKVSNFPYKEEVLTFAVIDV